MSGNESSSVETNRQNFNSDRRAEKSNYDEQMAYFWMNEEMADIEFVFKRNDQITVCLPSNRLHNFLLFSLVQKIPAHKFALTVASEVFQKEFTYKFEKEEEEEGVKRSKFLQVLFTYTI